MTMFPLGAEAQWSKVGGTLNSQTTTIRGPELYFYNVGIEDRGVYVCGVENEAGASRDSAILEVERREPPTIEIYPSPDQTVVEGGSVLFQCRVLTGIPAPEIQWRPLLGNGFGRNVEVLAEGGVVRITEITKANEGQYECTASNLAGSVEEVAYLKVTVPPKISLEPSGSIQVSPGESVQLRCTATGEPTPEVTWEKIQGYIPSSASRGAAVHSMSRVTKEDEGTYLCKAVSEAGETEEIVQVIVVEQGSNAIDYNNEDDYNNNNNQVVTVEDSVNAPLNGNARLTCKIIGPVELRIQWIRTDNRALPVNSYDNNGELYIPNVQPEDSGPYSCQALDPSGRVIFSANTRLIISS